MTITATEQPTLAPTTDIAPIEQAIVDGIVANEQPETFLWILFRRPDGGTTLRYAWTAGGRPLGDQIDTLALAVPLDGADWTAITGRHRQDSARGRIEIQAHPLRPILADISAGDRASDEFRTRVLRLVQLAADRNGQRPMHPAARWLGVGPTLLTSTPA